MIRNTRRSFSTNVLVFVTLININFACMPRASLPVQPEASEATFIRICELFVTDFESMRTQTETLSALEAISPPGRVCFVCQRLRACAIQLQQHQRATNLTAHQVSSLACSLVSKPLPVDLLPGPGGELLQQALDRNCRACRTLPVRIQKGTW